MKVKDIVSKCRLRDTAIIFMENGKVFEETTMEKLYCKDQPLIMDRTLNSWEIKDNGLIIWVKPQEEKSIKIGTVGVGSVGGQMVKKMIEEFNR